MSKIIYNQVTEVRYEAKIYNYVNICYCLFAHRMPQNKKYHTEEEKAAAARSYRAKHEEGRIRIRLEEDEARRWQALMLQKGLASHSEVAKLLLNW